MKLEYLTFIKDGKIQTNIGNAISKEIKHFEGKRVKISIEKFSGARTYRQNRLWWAYISMVAKEIGYDNEELHEIAKFKFLKREKVDEKTGEILQFIASTTTLNKDEFTELVESFRRWCAEMFYIVLPDPGETWELINQND